MARQTLLVRIMLGHGWYDGPCPVESLPKPITIPELRGRELVDAIRELSVEIRNVTANGEDTEYLLRAGISEDYVQALLHKDQTMFGALMQECKRRHGKVETID